MVPVQTSGNFSPFPMQCHGRGSLGYHSQWHRHKYLARIQPRRLIFARGFVVSVFPWLFQTAAGGIGIFSKQSRGREIRLRKGTVNVEERTFVRKSRVCIRKARPSFSKILLQDSPAKREKLERSQGVWPIVFRCV